MPLSTLATEAKRRSTLEDSKRDKDDDDESKGGPEKILLPQQLLRVSAGKKDHEDDGVVKTPTKKRRRRTKDPSCSSSSRALSQQLRKQSLTQEHRQQKQKATSSNGHKDHPKNTSHQRTNWGMGAAKERLEQAVQEWDHHHHDGQGQDGRKVSLREFAQRVDIPYHTFRKYVAPKSDIQKRRRIGVGIGRQPLLTPDQQDAIVQALAQQATTTTQQQQQQGTSGEGGYLLPNQAVDFVLAQHPTLTRAQAQRHLHRTLLQKQHQHPATRQQQPRILQIPTNNNKNQGGDEKHPEDSIIIDKAHANDDDDVGENDTDDGAALKRIHAASVVADNNNHNDDEGKGSKRRQEQALAAINIKIHRLQTLLAQAELEKERILSEMKQERDDA